MDVPESSVCGIPLELPLGSWLDLAAASWVGGLAAVKYPPVRLPEKWYEVGPHRTFWECAFWLPMAHPGFPRAPRLAPLGGFRVLL